MIPGINRLILQNQRYVAFRQLMKLEQCRGRASPTIRRVHIVAIRKAKNIARIIEADLDVDIDEGGEE